MMHVRSAGVAALLAAGAILSAQKPAADPGFQAEVKAALDKSRPVLLKKLSKAHGGELALLCLAAVHDAVPRDDKVMVKAMKKLSRIKLGRTYDVALRLMVASEYPWLPKRQALAATDLKRLLRNITNAGGFDYDAKRKRWDLSNSQYGALGLRAAAAMGLEIPAKTWRQLLAATLTAQGDKGGFAYMQHQKDFNVSMTTAGIAVLQICDDYLDDKTVKAFEVKKRLDAAFEFLIEHKGEIGDRKTKNCYYFHYGLERACILSDVEDVDGKDWYRSGAEMLLRTQLRGGGWHSPNDHIQGGRDRDGSDAVSTSFAILFLRRKFQKVVGPITPGGAIAIGQLTAQSSAKDVDQAVQGAVARGRSALPAVLRAMRSPIKPRRVAGARALTRISGKDFGFDPDVAPEKSRSAVTKAELWWLKSRSAGKK